MNTHHISIVTAGFVHYLWANFLCPMPLTNCKANSLFSGQFLQSSQFARQTQETGCSMNHKPSLSEGTNLDFTKLSKDVGLKNSLHLYQSSWMWLMSSKGTKKSHLYQSAYFQRCWENKSCKQWQITKESKTASSMQSQNFCNTQPIKLQ